MESYNTDSLFEVVIVVRNREIVALPEADLETAISVAQALNTSHRATTVVRNVRTRVVAVVNFAVTPTRIHAVAPPVVQMPAVAEAMEQAPSSR
jgi:hypothetical protein